MLKKEYEIYEMPLLWFKKNQKNGHYKNIQRYKCLNPKCKRSFRDKNYNIKYKKEKDFVQILHVILNLRKIRNNYSKLPLFKLFSNIQNSEDKTIINSIRIRKANDDTRTIRCQNPKAILCECNDELRIVLLPELYYDGQYLDKRINIKIINTPDQTYTVNGKKVHVEY